MRMHPILAGEHRTLEYKRSLTRALLKTVSAFANDHDGRIVLGIADDGTVIGIDDPKAVRLELENMLNDNVQPRPYYEIETETLEDKKILILTVYQGEHTPYMVEGKAYRRSDTASIAVDRYGLQELMLRGRNQLYEEIAADVQKLSFTVLSKLLYERLKISEIGESVFKTLELTTPSGYNRAASWLSDENPEGHAGMTLVRFIGTGVIGMKDVIRLEHVSVLIQFDEAMAFFRKHVSTGELIDGAYRSTREEVPFVAYREAVANAIAHRDYARPGEIRIEIFDDRIEITSPGGLPPGLSEEEYVAGRVSIPRNRILSNILFRVGVMERLATGVRRIREMYADSKSKPLFDVTANAVCVRLPHMVNGSSMSDPQTEYRVDAVLTNQEETILLKLHSEGSITRKQAEELLGLGKTQAYGVLDRLVEKRLAMRIGSARSVRYVLANNE